MKRLGLFVDVSNLYYCISKKYKNKKLDYKKLVDYCKDLGEIQQSTAYGAQIKNEAAAFIHCLKGLGFNIKYKQPKIYENMRKADWDVGIAIDMVTTVEGNSIDMMIICTADGDMTPAVEWVISKGINVIILACGISRDLKNTATKFIEIPESFLE